MLHDRDMSPSVDLVFSLKSQHSLEIFLFLFLSLKLYLEPKIETTLISRTDTLGFVFFVSNFIHEPRKTRQVVKS